MSDEGGIYRGLVSYGDKDFSRYLRRTFLHASGRSPESLDRPVIGIATSASDFNPCHRQQPELVKSVVRGVLAAGGMPMEFPTISLGESFLEPTAMVYRNLMAVDVEELVRTGSTTWRISMPRAGWPQYCMSSAIYWTFRYSQ